MNLTLNWLDIGAIFGIAFGVVGAFVKYSNEKLARAERELGRDIQGLKQDQETLRTKADDKETRLVKLEVLMENVSKVLERIEAKIDRHQS